MTPPPRSLRSASTSLAILALSSCAFWRTAPIDIEKPDTPIEQARFEKKILATGLKQPMEMEILPDGKVLFIEIGGDFRLYDPAKNETSTVGHINVFTPMENGLLGLALDPKFEKNNWIYVFYSAPGKVPEQHVSRFVFKNGKLDNASEKILLRIPTQRDECCHQAGSIEFGPDGCLFISTGDNTNPFDSEGYSPTDYRPKRSPWDAGKSSGNTNDLRGKILRIRPEADGTYSIPSGNLFDPADPAARPEVYVMGCRNPFRIGVDQKTGYLYWGEVGPDAGEPGPRGPRGYDEINQARAAGNFGWPYVIADNQPYAQYDFAAKKVESMQDPAAPVNRSPSNTGHQTLPAANKAFIWYPYAASAEFPVVGTGGRTACAGPVYDHNPKLRSRVKLPARYDRCLFAYEWERGWIKAVKLDADSNIVWIEDFAPELKFLRPVQLKIGPEGDLYVLEYGTTWGENDDAKLVRVQYLSGNRAPIAKAQAANVVGKAPLEVEFASEGTTDRDGDPIKLRWDFGDGKSDPESPNPTHVYEKAGTYRAKLTATDPDGLSETAEVIIRAGNEVPRLKFLDPPPGTLVAPEEPLAYRIEMKDAEDSEEIDPKQLAAAVYLTPFWRAKRPAKPVEIDGPPEPRPLTMMKRSNCFNCHAIERKVVGPSYIDVAARYADADEKTMSEIMQRVLKGSTGVWGDVPMLPHEQHSEQELREMVSWVISLAKGGAAPRPIAGSEGLYTPPKPEGAGDGELLLTASYTDYGAENAERLEGKSQLRLRGRRLGAEFYDREQGTQIHDTNDGGGQMVDFINDGDWIAFDGVQLGAWTKMDCRVSSADAGGWIELRVGSPTGELLGKAEAPVTGDWGKWTTVEGPIQSPGGAHDLYFVFVNKESSGRHLFNLNWIEFK